MVLFILPVIILRYSCFKIATINYPTFDANNIIIAIL